MSHPLDNTPSDEQADHPLGNEEPRQRHPFAQDPQKRKPDVPEKPKQMIRLPRRIEKPYATYTLLAINVVIFVIGLVSNSAWEWLVVNGVNIPYYTAHGQIYRLVTSMFLHGNLAHIAFNMLALLYLGRLLESLFGRTRFLLIYFLGGLGGSVLSTLLNEGGLGASGAVFALWGGELIYLYRNRELYGGWARQRMQQSLMLMGLNFAYGIFVNVNAQEGGTLIGNFAHLGGLIGGVLLTFMIGPRIHIPPQTPDVVNGIRIYNAEDTNDQPKGWLSWLALYVLGLVILMVAAGLIITSPI